MNVRKFILPNDKETIKSLIEDENTWFIIIRNFMNKSESYVGFTHLNPAMLNYELPMYDIIHITKLSCQDICQLKTLHDIELNINFIRERELQLLLNNNPYWKKENDTYITILNGRRYILEKYTLKMYYNLDQENERVITLTYERSIIKKLLKETK